MNELIFTLIIILFFYQIVLVFFMMHIIKRQKIIEERFEKQEKSIILLIKVLGVIKNNISEDDNAEFTNSIKDELYGEARDSLF